MRPNDRPTKVIIVLINTILFVLINTIVLFATSLIKFGAATDADKQLKYVDRPSFEASLIASILIVLISYLFYKTLTFFWKKAPLWGSGIFILLTTTTIMYIFSTFSYVGVAGFWNQVLIALKFMVLTCANFFIPYVERFLDRRMNRISDGRYFT